MAKILRVALELHTRLFLMSNTARRMCKVIAQIGSLGPLNFESFDLPLHISSTRQVQAVLEEEAAMDSVRVPITETTVPPRIGPSAGDSREAPAGPVALLANASLGESDNDKVDR